MSKDNRDEIIIICDALEKRKKNSNSNNFNPITESRKILKYHISNNYDNYLKLKIQAKEHLKFNQNTFSLIAFLFSFFSIINTFSINAFDIYYKEKWMDINEIGINALSINIFSFVIICVFVLITFHYYNLNLKREKWLNYILSALEDIEKNFKAK